MIKVYDAREQSFNSNGLGSVLPLKCIESKSQSLNGWSIEVETSIEYSSILIKDNIITVETKEKGIQPFRIGNPSYTNKRISFVANHIVFDSEKYLLDSVTPKNLTAAVFLNWINFRTDITSPFIVDSDIEKITATSEFTCVSYLEALEETEKLFGGVYDIDGFKINLKQKVGKDNGVSIAYGKNLQSMRIVEDWSTVCTKLLPVGPDDLKLTDQYVYADIQYETPYTRSVSFSIDKKTESGADKTIQQMRTELLQKAKDYLNESKVPKVNYEIESNIEQSLGIGDTISVKHPLVDLKTKVISYTYDVLTRRVKTLAFGNYVRDVKTVFQDLKNNIKEAVEKADQNYEVVQHQTDIINNLNKLGNVYIDDSEILILDKLPKESAKNVWRIGLGGFGFSKNGYKGPFDVAITQDGAINGNFISAGVIKGIELSGNTITGGKIKGSTIEGNTISGGTIKGALVDGNTITGGNITGTKITGSTINGGNITGSTIDVDKSISIGEALYLTNSTGAVKRHIYLSDEAYLRVDDLDGSVQMIINFSRNKQQNAFILFNDFGITNLWARKQVSLSAPVIMASTPITVGSDIRLKENINAIDISDLVERIKVKRFDYINGAEYQVGVIAQDLLGDKYKDYLISELSTDGISESRYSVDYNVILMACVQQIQKLNKKVNELEKKDGDK
ncbi:phage tail spike protein [Breznakia pachnodae]|uniref:Phage minor structural protein n=1 Tax=Breznakia pachnodae TaxID=265178 RepID=A0ABU0DYH9_9FIRM|nr:phage tail spike protein [Breznakia pachnodae]MDQ0359698.1 phage minor structural protein [Breznakia pachnodae]